MRKKIIRIFLLVLFVFLFFKPGYAQDETDLFNEGVLAAENGQPDFAFMHFHTLLKYSSFSSKYFPVALFAAGEYYFLIGDYDDAQNSFTQFSKKFPKAKALPFALAYLWKISKEQNKNQTPIDLKKQMINYKQLALIFSEFQEYNYRSGLGKRYKALYFIDRAEFYIDEQLFVKIQF